MRVTTSTDRSLDIYEQKVVHADFGIVNFSRLMGSVFNDYSNDKVRQADSPSLQNITLVVFGGMQRKVVTDGAGDFEIDDLSPGRYEIAIDLHVPAATVRLPREPIQINDAVIVITNPQLLQYLTATPPD